jgi:hypothetical protein
VTAHPVATFSNPTGSTNLFSAMGAGYLTSLTGPEEPPFLGPGGKRQVSTGGGVPCVREFVAYSF